MFKRPFKVELDTDSVTVNHQISVTPATIEQAESLIKDVGKTVVTVVAAAYLVLTVADIAKHTAKTRIK